MDRLSVALKALGIDMPAGHLDDTSLKQYIRAHLNTLCGKKISYWYTPDTPRKEISHKASAIVESINYCCGINFYLKFNEHTTGTIHVGFLGTENGITAKQLHNRARIEVDRVYLETIHITHHP